jgi:hypothetical protein
MQLKNLATASFGVLLSLKAMACDKDLYGVDMTRIESDRKIPGDENLSYKIPTHYEIKDFFAFDATAIGQTRQSSIFGAQMTPSELQSLVEIPENDGYVFNATLQLPGSTGHDNELESTRAVS